MINGSSGGDDAGDVVTGCSATTPVGGMAKKRQKVEEACRPLVLSQQELERLSATVLKEIEDGLSQERHEKSSVKCFPTFVRELPNGRETGKFLALDLGGTNFRVLLIILGEGKFQMSSKIFAIPTKIMLGTGEALFDHIAECLADFVTDENIVNEKLPLGFTFSFPCEQEGLTKARLVKWTKGFKCSGVEGEDVVELLKHSIAKRKDIRIEVCAMLNDTTGCLMSCAWLNRNCLIGVIIGTGSNACYMEKLDRVDLWTGDREVPCQVIINTEWGALGENGCLEFIRTDYDRQVDEGSLNPGKQLFEKMISGMYMGELVRVVLVDLATRGLIFEGLQTDALLEPNSFFTKFVSEIESDLPDSCENTRNVLEDELDIDGVSDEDCELVRLVCEFVSKRAAAIVSAGVAVLVNRVNQPRVTVAVDGSVYRFHPHFHNLMVRNIRDLIKPGLQFNLMLSEDGSGRGAALVAAVASRIKKARKAARKQSAAS